MSIRTVNRAWSLLFGEPGTPAADWIRYTEVAVPAGSVAGVFTDTDLHIRGWLVEAAIRAALLSSYKDTVLSLDPVNSYDYPLAGETAFFTTTLENGGVIPTVMDHTLGVYEKTVPYEITVVEGGYTLVSIDSVVVNVSVVTDTRMLNIPFTGTGLVNLIIPAVATGTLTFSITGKVLPASTPLSIICERVLKAYPGNGFEKWPTLEIMGWLAVKALGGING